MNRLKKLFNKVSAAVVLSAGIIAGPVAAGAQERAPEPQTRTQPLQNETTADCPAFPGFRRPLAPMHRVLRNIEPDPAVEEKQELLDRIGLDPGRIDGRPGMSTRQAELAYLLFYGPLYNATSQQSLDANDTEKLRAYAQQATRDAAAYKIPVHTAGILRLASLQTGVGMAQLADAVRLDGGRLEGVRAEGASPGDLFKFDHTTWLYLVKTYGAQYGLEFYAANIDLGALNGDVTATVANPFVHRQILALKANDRLSALMAAEHLRNSAQMPALDVPALPAFSGRTQEEQQALFDLGFDIGPGKRDGIKGTMTDIAIREFQVLHGAGIPTGTLTADERRGLLEAAARANREESAYSVPAAAVGAIRMASLRSRLEFGYMMELAEAESAFIHNIKASTSSATGLFQFIESTWLYMIKNYGHQYGLGGFAAEIEIYTDDYGREMARVNNPLIRDQLIELRKHPHLSSLFSADFQLENKSKEMCYVAGGNLGRTDLYLAHFLGAHDAVYFINALRENPGRSAAETFPEAAESNPGVFHVTQGRRIVRARTLQEVYDFFDGKFNRGGYEDSPVRIGKAPAASSAPAGVAALRPEYAKNAPAKQIARKPPLKKKAAAKNTPGKKSGRQVR